MTRSAKLAAHEPPCPVEPFLVSRQRASLLALALLREDHMSYEEAIENILGESDPLPDPYAVCAGIVRATALENPRHFLAVHPKGPLVFNPIHASALYSALCRAFERRGIYYVQAEIRNAVRLPNIDPGLLSADPHIHDFLLGFFLHTGFPGRSPAECLSSARAERQLFEQLLGAGLDAGQKADVHCFVQQTFTRSHGSDKAHEDALLALLAGGGDAGVLAARWLCAFAKQLPGKEASGSIFQAARAIVEKNQLAIDSPNPGASAAAHPRKTGL